MDLRDEANYKNARFIEPNIPPHFVKIVNGSIRLACQSYLSDNTGLYAFDHEHAILAYPLEVIKWTLKLSHERRQPPYKSDDMPFLRELLSDKNGPMSYFLRIMEKQND